MAEENANARKKAAFTHAKEIYKTEMGYRAINNFLSRRIHSGELRYKQATAMIDPLSDTFEGTPLETIVEDLRWGMRIENRKKTKEDVYDPRTVFYRGGSCDGKRSYRLETFLSITDDLEEAESYKNGCIFKIQLDPKIDHTSYGKNENETLLIDGCFWEYKGMEPSSGYPLVHIHSRAEWEHMPENSRPPWKGDRVPPVKNTQKAVNEIERRRKEIMEEEPINWNAGGGRRRRHTRHRMRRKRSVHRTRRRQTRSQKI